jgi:type I restriction enzyme R subunit
VTALTFQKSSRRDTALACGSALVGDDNHIKHQGMQNPTLVVLTDRNDLDDQLFATFSMCKDLLRQTPQQAEDRDHLRKLLDRPSGEVIFTTLQKFAPAEG